MTQSLGIANIVGSAVNSLNPGNYEAMYRKVRALPVTKTSHLNVVTGVIHSKALARPKYIKLYAAMCARLIKGGFNNAHPDDSGPAFQTALLPKCYDNLKECCKISETRQCTERRTNEFVTNCQFIGELFKLGVYPKEMVWSYVNELVNKNSCKVQVRCLCALLRLVRPNLSETCFAPREMLLERKENLNCITTVEPDVLDDKNGTSVTEYSEEVTGDLMQPAIESSVDSVDPEPGSGSIVTSDYHDITANNAPLRSSEAKGVFAYPQRYYAILNHSSVGFPLTGNLFSPLTQKSITSKHEPLPEISLDKINSISEGRSRDRWSARALLTSKFAVTGILVGLSVAGFVIIVPAVLRKWFN